VSSKIKVTFTKSALFVFLAFGAAVSAQEISVVTGQLTRDRGPVPDDLIVQLYDPAHGSIVGQAMMLPGGRFELSRVPAGEFVLRVTSRFGESLVDKPVSIRRSGASLEIQLPSAPRERPAAGVISVARLRHKVPPKAERAFRQAVKAQEAGDSGQSLAHLQEAVRIDPDYMEAHNDLGARYMSAGQFDRAAEEFERAVSLDPSATGTLLNLAGAWFALRRHEEAEAAARRALRQDTHSLRGYYLLGFTLMVQQKYGDETLQAFQRAASKYPNAHLAAAEVLLRQGSRDRARQELREYLKSPDGEKRAEVQAWLVRLGE